MDLGVGVRIVIAKHWPERVFESGPATETLEKKLCDEPEVAPNVISLVRQASTPMTGSATAECNNP
jgi:hypothetical protein